MYCISPPPPRLSDLDRSAHSHSLQLHYSFPRKKGEEKEEEKEDVEVTWCYLTPPTPTGRHMHVFPRTTKEINKIGPAQQIEVMILVQVFKTIQNPNPQIQRPKPNPTNPLNPDSPPQPIPTTTPNDNSKIAQDGIQKERDKKKVIIAVVTQQ